MINNTLVKIKDYDTKQTKENLFCHSLTIGNKDGKTVIKLKLLTDKGEKEYKSYSLNNDEYLFITDLAEFIRNNLAR